VPLLGQGGSLEDKITYKKGMLMYLSSVISMKSLLVADRLHHGGVPLFFEHVDVRLVLFLCSLLVIEVDTWSVRVEVRGDDYLSPVDEEEGGAPHRAVHARLQAPKEGGEFIHPSSGVDLELIVDVGFDPIED
jgi:hypothetical protein